MSQPTHQAGEMDKKPPAAKGPPPIKRQRLEAVKDSTVPCLANNASALLTSSLLGEIVAHQIMAFLDPKEILVFLQTQPTICKKFHLDTFFCVQHGNKMEMKPSAMVWNGHLDTETPRKIIEGVVVTYVEKGTNQEHCIFHSETVPSLKCVECVMEARGEQRCHDCSLFYPKKDYTFTCDDCEVTRCQFWCINEVIGDPGKCKKTSESARYVVTANVIEEEIAVLSKTSTAAILATIPITLTVSPTTMMEVNVASVLCVHAVMAAVHLETFVIFVIKCFAWIVQICKLTALTFIVAWTVSTLGSVTTSVKTIGENLVHLTNTHATLTTKQTFNLRLVYGI